MYHAILLISLCQCFQVGKKLLNVFTYSLKCANEPLVGNHVRDHIIHHHWTSTEMNYSLIMSPNDFSDLVIYLKESFTLLTLVTKMTHTVIITPAELNSINNLTLNMLPACWLKHPVKVLLKLCSLLVLLKHTKMLLCKKYKERINVNWVMFEFNLQFDVLWHTGLEIF